MLIIQPCRWDNPSYNLYPNVQNSSQTKKKEEVRSFTSDCFWFTIDAGGIMATMLMMGWLQERIITKQYTRISDPLQVQDLLLYKSFFTSLERQLQRHAILGILQQDGCPTGIRHCTDLDQEKVLWLLILFISNFSQPPHVPPYYVHSYTSFANTMSSWCQYEALKFVSFPTQTICKVSKVVATMLMGKVVRGQRWDYSPWGNTIVTVIPGLNMSRELELLSVLEFFF